MKRLQDLFKQGKPTPNFLRYSCYQIPVPLISNTIEIGSIIKERCEARSMPMSKSCSFANGPPIPVDESRIFRTLLAM